LRSRNGRYLSERAAIFYAPSIDFLSTTGSHRGDKTD
jgi:hypothetical protein